MAVDAGLDEHDEGYFASMTDIMVGLLFVFIIIIMFFALQISEAGPDAVSRAEHERILTERDEALLRVAGLERRVTDLTVKVAGLTAEVERLRALVTRLELEIAKLEDEASERSDGAAVDADVIARLRDEIDELERTIERLEAELVTAREDRLSTYLSAADDRRSLILRRVRDIMAEAGLDVEIVEEQGVVRLPNDLLFDTGRSTIDDDGRAASAVAKLAEALARVLPCYTVGPRSDPRRDCNPSAAFVETVFVEGHTDIAPVRGEIEPGIDSNLRLSARRASNIFDRLRALDAGLLAFRSVDGEPVLNVAAYGETRPVRGARTVGDEARDRRIDLRFLMLTPRSDTLDDVQSLVADAPPDAGNDDADGRR